MKALLCKALSLIISFVSLVAWHTGQATFPDPTKRIDLSRFTMTFEDEFATNFSVYNLISAIKELAYLADFEEYAKRGVYDAKVNYFESSLGKDWRAYLEDEEFINVDAILKY